MQNNQIVLILNARQPWDGREVWFELSNSVIEPTPAANVTKYFPDITERRKAEKEIRLLLKPPPASVNVSVSPILKII
jgi:PAS domain-containing protein